jgi:hypothetical protein
VAKFRVHDPIAEPEPEVALQQVATVEVLQQGVRVKTVGAEEAYHRRDFVAGCRQRGIAPQLACKHGVRVAGLDVRTRAKPGYRLSQKVRKRVEEIFWLDQHCVRIETEPVSSAAADASVWLSRSCGIVAA